MSIRDIDRAARAAAICAGAMIAQQVAGKAARDALFLSHYEVTSLPVMLVVASLFSLAAVVAFTRAMTRLGPARLVPMAYAGSAALLIGSWGLAGVRPDLAAIALYLHVGGFGSVLISGFWSLVNERFDPRSGKERIGRITAGATLGGLLGGALAERAATYGTVTSVLPLLAVLHLFCAWRLRAVYSEPASSTPRPAEVEPRSGADVLREVPYLRNLAALILLVTVMAALVDYVLKSHVAAAYPQGEDLLRFFALYYAGVGLVTFMVQTGLGRLALENFGLAGTVATLPAAVGIGSAGAMLHPGILSAVLVNGIQAVFRSSLFRAGYELLFTPVSERDKRASKTIVDVGFVRLGDGVGGLAVKATLMLVAPHAVASVLMGGAAALGVIALGVAGRLHRGYVKALEASLVRRAVEIDLSQVEDGTTRTTILRSLFGGELDDSLLTFGRSSPVQDSLAEPDSKDMGRGEDPASGAIVQDPLVRRVAGLRSGDLASVQDALASHDPLDPVLAGHVIRLLAWDAVYLEALQTLAEIAPRITGQLLDSLLDPEETFAIRRRVPRVLRANPCPAVVNGLLMGLTDRRFEVRYQCGRSLLHVADADEALRVPRAEVYAAVSRETEVDPSVWENQRVLDGQDEESPFGDAKLRKRINRSVEHVFTLLSLVLPRRPLQIAFRGLYSPDSTLRGTALEYLQSVLPSSVREGLWPFLSAERCVRESQQGEEALAALLASRRSIEISLEALRDEEADRAGGEPPS